MIIKTTLPLVMIPSPEMDRVKDDVAGIKSVLIFIEAAMQELTPPEDSPYKRRTFNAIQPQIEHLIQVADSVSKHLPDYSLESV